MPGLDASDHRVDDLAAALIRMDHQAEDAPLVQDLRRNLTGKHVVPPDQGDDVLRAHDNAFEQFAGNLDCFAEARFEIKMVVGREQLCAVAQVAEGVHSVAEGAQLGNQLA